jgi:hypothetical protein
LAAAWLCRPVKLVGLQAGDGDGAADAFALHPWGDGFPAFEVEIDDCIEIVPGYLLE